MATAGLLCDVNLQQFRLRRAIKAYKTIVYNSFVGNFELHAIWKFKKWRPLKKHMASLNL